MISLLAHVDDFNQQGQSLDYGQGMMSGSSMMGWWPMMGGGWFSGLLGLIIGGLVILMLVALFRWLWRKGTMEEGEKK